MGPIETLQDVTQRHFKQLQREGLNPFDLLRWNYLKNLYTEVVASGHRGDFEDREVHKNTKQAIWAALERKAEAISLDTQDDTVEHELDEMRNL